MSGSNSSIALYWLANSILKSKMNDKHRSVLRRNRPKIVKDLHQPHIVADYLLANSILLEDMVSDVYAKDTRENKVRHLIDMLPRRGPNAFKTFIQSLQQAGECELAKLLDPECEYRTVPPPPSYEEVMKNYTAVVEETSQPQHYTAVVEETPQPQLDRRLRQIFMYLSRNLGSEWKFFVRSLNIEDNKIDEIIGAHPFNVQEQIHQLMCIWSKTQQYDIVTCIQSIHEGLRFVQRMDILRDVNNM